MTDFCAKCTCWQACATDPGGGRRLGAPQALVELGGLPAHQPQPALEEEDSTQYAAAGPHTAGTLCNMYNAAFAIQSVVAC